MATISDLKIALVLDDRFSAALQGVSTRAGVIAGGVAAITTKALDSITHALRGMVDLTSKAITAANEQEDAEKKLTTALGYKSLALLDYASALQRATRFGDEEIIGAQARIAMFVKDEEQIKAATKATLDFAAVTGNLSSAEVAIAKTLGSTVNALGRYGIEVKGAAGSQERFNSLIAGMARVFGSQAVAAAETFAGKMAQVKNAYSEILEEVGFVITRNQFFINGLDFLKTKFFGLADTIKDNRLWLMELTKSGILTFVSGMGGAVAVMQFFHNGWLGIRFAANFALIGIADGLRIALEALNLFMWPFKKLFDGLVAFKIIDKNYFADVFDTGREALENFQASSRSVLKDTIFDIEKTNIAYDKVRHTIRDIEVGLRGMRVAQIESAPPPTKPLPTIESAPLPTIDDEARLTKMRETVEAEKLLQMERVQTAVLGSNIVTAAQQSMADQMLNMVEAGKFSTEEFGKVIVAQVKMTLTGIAAEATIRALYSTALGFYYAAIPGMQGYSAAAFTAAAEMAVTAGIALASTVGVQTLFGGQTAKPAAGSVGGEPIRTTPVSPNISLAPATASQTAPISNVTVIVQNGTGDNNYWQKLIDDVIVPGINDAANRNINLTIRTV